MLVDRISDLRLRNAVSAQNQQQGKQASRKKPGRPSRVRAGLLDRAFVIRHKTIKARVATIVLDARGSETKVMSRYFATKPRFLRSTGFMRRKSRTIKNVFTLVGGCYISLSVIVQAAVSLTGAYSLRVNFESVAVVRQRVESSTFPPKLHAGNGC